MSEEKKQPIESMELFSKEKEKQTPALYNISVAVAVILLILSAICLFSGWQAYNSYSRTEVAPFYFGAGFSSVICAVVVWVIGSIYAVLWRIEKTLEKFSHSQPAPAIQKE